MLRCIMRRFLLRDILELQICKQRGCVYNVARKLHSEGLENNNNVNIGPATMSALKYLNKKQKKHYDENGYIVVENVLKTSEIDQVNEAIEDFRQWSSRLTQSNEVYCLSKKHTKSNPILERVICPSLHHPTFAELIRHPKVLDIVENLIGPSFRYMPQEKLNIKPADGGLAIPWHQDWSFFPHTNDSVLTVSLIMDDSSRENGCLQVIPGSHRGPLYSHFKDGRFASCIHDDSFKPNDPTFLEAPRGSITVHHVRLVHGSASNQSNRPRRIACFIYNSTDAWPLLGVAGPDFGNVGPVDWNMFNATIVRGHPTEYPRLKDCPVRLPLPLLDPSTVLNDFEDSALPQI